MIALIHIGESNRPNDFGQLCQAGVEAENMTHASRARTHLIGGGHLTGVSSLAATHSVKGRWFRSVNESGHTDKMGVLPDTTFRQFGGVGATWVYEVRTYRMGETE